MGPVGLACKIVMAVVQVARSATNCLHVTDSSCDHIPLVVQKYHEVGICSLFWIMLVEIGYFGAILGLGPSYETVISES